MSSVDGPFTIRLRRDGTVVTMMFILGTEADAERVHEGIAIGIRDRDLRFTIEGDLTIERDQ